MRKTFVAYIEWAEILQDLPEELRLHVYDSIFSYAKTGEPARLDNPLANMAFQFIKRDLDRGEVKWQDVKKKRSEAGKKGNRVRWSETSQEVANAKPTSQKSQEVANAKPTSQKSQKVANAKPTSQKSQKVANAKPTSQKSQEVANIAENVNGLSNDNLNNITAAVADNAHMHVREELPEQEQTYLQALYQRKTVWREHAMRILKIPSDEEMDELIPVFVDEWQAQGGEPHDSESNMKSHFVSMMRIKLERQREQEKRNNYNNGNGKYNVDSPEAKAERLAASKRNFIRHAAEAAGSSAEVDAII